MCITLLHCPDNDSQLWQHNTRCSILTPSVLELFLDVTGLRCYKYTRKEVQCRRKMTIYVCVTCTRASTWGFLGRRKDETLFIGPIMDLPGCIAAARRGKALFSGRFRLARSCLRPTSCLSPPSALRKPVVAPRCFGQWRDPRGTSQQPSCHGACAARLSFCAQCAGTSGAPRFHPGNTYTHRHMAFLKPATRRYLRQWHLPDALMRNSGNLNLDLMSYKRLNEIGIEGQLRIKSRRFQ